MRKHLALLGAIAIATLAHDGIAQDDPAITAAVSEPAAPKLKDRVFCTRLTAIGSNMPRKVCRTAAQWQQIRKRGRGRLDPLSSAERTEERPGQN